MNIIVDTNIVFSAILNTSGIIGDLLFNSKNIFDFFSPELMKSEIYRYYEKLKKISKMNNYQLNDSINRILSQIDIIDEEIISHDNWVQAFNLVKNIDEDDTPFVALTLELDGILWTGDKELINGLKLIEWNKVSSSRELERLRGY